MMLFDVRQETRQPRDVVKTVYMDETLLISDLLWLYNSGYGVDIDPCYSVGRLWENLPRPAKKYDIEPQAREVIQCDCRTLPVDDASADSIFFDPPFIANTSQHNLGRIGNRFSTFRTMEDLQNMYSASLAEFFRILRPKGRLIVKCQDIVGKDHYQYLTHVFVINEAESLGFYSRDLFILIKQGQMISAHMKQQKHARKSHSYYLIFLKGRNNKCFARRAI